MNAKISTVLRDVVGPMFRRPKGLQVAALCHRPTKTGSKEVLLVTSRGTGRWILPKGWPMRGKSEAEAAVQEAWEEAGVKAANVQEDPIGSYAYDKVLGKGLPVPVETLVYAVEVEDLARDFPEADERTRKWVTPQEAADLVAEPQLSRLLKVF
ncbi:MAG: NUDIX hydrolase [Pseudomonadota bacterium]